MPPNHPALLLHIALPWDTCNNTAPFPLFTCREQLHAHFTSGAYASSGVNLFLLGLPASANGLLCPAKFKAEDLVLSVLRALEEDLGPDAAVTLCCRRDTVTLKAGGYRDVQIVLRMDGQEFSSLPHLLHSFDNDACSFAFDGSTAWASWRGLRALCFGSNVADLALAGANCHTFEQRLVK